jgi:hypothetical protein
MDTISKKINQLTKAKTITEIETILNKINDGFLDREWKKSQANRDTSEWVENFSERVTKLVEEGTLSHIKEDKKQENIEI